MPFAAPLALVGLAFVPLVIAFWMLKLRRTERTVSSTLLWQRFGEDLQANAPWQRLRRSFLLLLQLLLVILLAFLAAQPFVERPATLARDLVIVIDASASMAATDVAPSRLEAARQAALGALRDLPSGGRVSVVAAGATPRVVANATTDMGRVRAALAGISATPATADMGEALALASALAARAGDAQVLIATDAAFTPPKDLEVAAPVTVLQVGRERKNQAIVAFAVRSSPTAVTRSVFISVANLDLEPTTERVELWGDGRLLEARDLFLDPVSRADVGVDDVPLDVHVLEARLAGEDQLGLDDRAWAVVPPDRLLRVLLVSDGDPYLETALSFLPNAELYGVKPAAYGPGTKPELFDLVIFDAALPATLPRVPTLAIAPPRTSPLGTVTGTLKDPALGRPAPDEPLLRYVDLTTLHVAQAARLTLPDWARTVVPTAAGDPLLYTGHPGRRIDRRPRLRAAALRPAAPGGVPDPRQQPRGRAGGRVPGAHHGRRAGQPGQPPHPVRGNGPARGPPRRHDAGPRPGRHRRRHRHLRLDRAAGRLHGHPAGAPGRQPGAVGITRRLALRRPDGDAGRVGLAVATAGRSRDARPVRRRPVRRQRVHDRARLGGRPGEAGLRGGRRRSRGRGERAAAGPRRPVDPPRGNRPRLPRPGGVRLPARRTRPDAALAGREAGAGCHPGRAGKPAERLGIAWRLRVRLGARFGRPAPREPGLMGITATAPLLLLLIPLVVGLVVGLQLLAKRGLGDTRARLALLARAVLISALVLALAGAAIVLPADRLATVFVVDLSDSVGNAGRAEALAFVRDALAKRPDGDVAGVVAFGKDALVERLPGELTDLDRIASTPVQAATDIGTALRLAGALFPDAAQQRIVLLSDGNDTTGTGQVEAARAGARGIQVTTRTIGLGASDEVMLDRISVPTTSRLGEELEVSVEIRSTVAQPAAVRLYADGALVATERTTLDAGITRVVFQVTPKEAGFHVFRAVVEAAKDTFPQNDRADASTLVSGPPRVLVVPGDEAVAADLVKALETREGDVVTMVPELVPDDPATLSGFDSIVLVDVPRVRFTTKQLEALRSVNRDFGKGLVMIGGTRSYGAGGYRDTPLEAALPVEMRVKNREKQPDVALVVVIDESGSMAACHCNTFDRNQAVQLAGVRKVDIGKEAILRAAAALQATDELGVVAFNERANWVVKRSPVGSIGDLQGSLGGITADGQTNIYAGLDEGVKALESAKATRRHLILLTDGWSSSGQYDAILARMKAAGHHALHGRRRGRRQPVPGAAGGPWRRPLLPGDEPVHDPRHLPQGDGAGLRPADRRGALLPGAHRFVADHPRPRRRLPLAPGLQRHDDQGGGDRGAGLRPLRPGAGPVAVRPGALGGLDVRRDRALGERAGSAGMASPASSASWWRGRSPARSPAASRPAS